MSMVDLIGGIIGIVFIALLLFLSFRSYVRERKEINNYRQELINTISQISLTLEEISK